MSSTVKAALILAAALIVAAILNGGVYEISAQRVGDAPMAYRLNRFTGEVKAIAAFRYVTIRAALPWAESSLKTTPDLPHRLVPVPAPTP